MKRLSERLDVCRRQGQSPNRGVKEWFSLWRVRLLRSLLLTYPDRKRYLFQNPPFRSWIRSLPTFLWGGVKYRVHQGFGMSTKVVLPVVTEEYFYFFGVKRSSV